ncbi:YdeI/OmpD-associated family protein [Knoellia sp. Soil729]|uniref:YdeI/OmpD-associated family protein n=1 Tax=Knoellia sp. Soil729 TaxID=1736394 RepID=UPI0006F8DE43|nr:YdeI/OmpD-associated family protein [Knoellia sp. Soil729]KRE41961.1 2-isopropylmalate synthase [Knoellia sp. Soil729]
MGETLHLTAVLEARGPAGGFTLTDEQVAALGDGAKAFPVVVTVNGKPIPLRLARMGGENLVGFSKANRAAAGVELGDEVTFDIAADQAPREVQVPDDLAAALSADPPVEAAFAALASSHRKEFVRWVTEAKREQTRAERVAKTAEMVRAGQTR